MRAGIVAASIALAALAGCGSSPEDGPGAPSGSPGGNDAAAAAELDAALTELEESNTGRSVERVTTSIRGLGDLVQVSEVSYDVHRLRQDISLRFEASTEEAERLLADQGATDLDSAGLRFFKDGEQMYVTAANDVYAGRWLRLDMSGPTETLASSGIGLNTDEGLPRLVALLRERTSTARSDDTGGRVEYTVRIPAELGPQVIGGSFVREVTSAIDDLTLTGDLAGTVSVSSTGIIDQVQLDLTPVLAQVRAQIDDPDAAAALDRMSVTAEASIDRVGESLDITPPPADKIVDSLDGS